MWRSGGIRQDSAAPQLPAPKSRFRGPFRLLVSGAVLLVTVVFIFPVVFKPGIEPPAPSPFASPFSIVVRISNQDVTPLMDVEYSCEVSKLALANGSIAGDAKVLVRGAIRKMPGRQAIAARCETAYIPNAPLSALEYQLTLAYRMYPWRQRRTSVYRIAAELNNQGQVTGWKLI
jgi:hypothetical protein